MSPVRQRRSGMGPTSPSAAQRQSGQDCGGYFLHSSWLATGRDDDPFDKMAFALTFDATDPDKLPQKNDRELNRVLHEATMIVASVHFKKPA